MTVISNAMLKRIRAVATFLFIAVASVVQAELTVDITKGVPGRIPLAVVPFGQAGLAGDNLASLVKADLAGTDRFNLMPESTMPERPAPPDSVNFMAWQSVGQEHVAIGRVNSLGPGRQEAEFFLFDDMRGSLLTSARIPFKTDELRHVAHVIADIIYQKLTGERGVFNSRIAYVTSTGTDTRREYRLEVADSDGGKPHVVVTSPEPIMSPAWSPDGKRLAYVSFEGRKSAIFIQELASGERQKISSFPGINGAPGWSPDGTKLALTLSRDGNPDVYIMELATKSLRRVTSDMSMETEPSWSPDGKNLVITSDQGGSPQLYLLAVNGGQPERITFEGDYNSRGVFSPDGRSMVMVHGQGGDFRIAMLDLGSKEQRVLTEGPLDDSPGFAPNGKLILYVHRENGVNRLATVSPDGKVRNTLKFRAEGLSSPAWSP